MDIVEFAAAGVAGVVGMVVLVAGILLLAGVMVRPRRVSAERRRADAQNAVNIG